MNGINFTQAMFHAVIEGRKTQTRRIMKPQPICDEKGNPTAEWENIIDCKPRYKVCETLHIKEPYKIELIGGKYKVTFAFSDIVVDLPQSVSPEGILKVQNLMRKSKTGYCNKLFVVKGLSEYFPHKIEITGVKAERLNDISDEDCLKEGIFEREKWSLGKYYQYEWNGEKFQTPQQAFAALIDSINGKGTWNSNLWVWVYEFKLLNNK